mgnify:CR=1 FL=1
MLKNLYALFLGLFLAVFIGVGIATFYLAPTPPEYPTVLSRPTPSNPDKQFDEETRLSQEKFDVDQKAFQQVESRYNRNVSTIVIAFAVLFLAISLIFEAKIAIIADGLLLGGIFTLLYGIMRGFMTDQMTYRFIVTTVGLIVALILGYIKFAHQPTGSTGATTRRRS